MSLCETVSKLASEIEPQLNDLSESHKNMLSALISMPKYLEKNDLSEWDENYTNSISDEEDETSKNYKAIYLLYEIAAYNLYTLYNPEKTEGLYAKVVKELKYLNITITNDLNVNKW
jgi:hypothetical protein